METSKKRIRREYAPLNVAVSLKCTTPGSLPTQVFNSDNGEYEPDRSLTPCVISPVVVAHAKDGSWRTSYANGAIGNMRWLVNGKDITTLPDWTGLYSINTDPGSHRGSLTIKKNILPGSVCMLRFKAQIADARTGLNIPVESDDMTLSTTDKSEDTYSLSIGESQIIRYDPFKDRLSQYEYKVAHGLIKPTEEGRAAAIDENCYICRIPLTVYKAHKVIKTDYSIRLYEVLDNGSLKEMLVDGEPSELISISLQEIVLDLRVITKADYIIKISAKDKQVAQEQFSVNRIYAKYTCLPTNGTSIGPNDTERYDEAMVDCDGHIVDCPASVLRIVWKTDSAKKKNVIHNEGGTTIFQLSKAGIGRTYQDDWMDVYTESGHKDAHALAMDETGCALTDENGNILIFN